MGLTVKNLVGYIPNKWLKEKQESEWKKVVILKNKNYIWSAQKDHCSTGEYEFLCLIFEAPRN